MMIVVFAIVNTACLLVNLDEGLVQRRTYYCVKGRDDCVFIKIWVSLMCEVLIHPFTC